MKPLLLTLWMMLCVQAAGAAADGFRVERMNGGQPIISRQLFKQAGLPAEDGSNINGPSLILPTTREPYICMAWSSRLEGPWHLYGADNPPGKRGVLDLGASRRKSLGPALAMYKHVASPDVFVDDKNRRIVMYFHAPVILDGLAEGEQRSFVATSRDGLDFHSVSMDATGVGIRPHVLGGTNFRVFGWRQHVYALANRGMLYELLLARRLPVNPVRL